MFEDNEGYDRALQLRDVRSYVEGSEACGMKKWQNQYNQARPDVNTLQTQVDMFLHAFDKRTEAEKEARKNQAPIIDEEGFMLVQAKSKRSASRDLKSAKAAVKKFKQRIQKQSEHAVSFYNFQEKERKLERINVLRRKFEEDKQKVNELKATRKFKPF